MHYTYNFYISLCTATTPYYFTVCYFIDNKLFLNKLINYTVAIILKYKTNILFSHKLVQYPLLTCSHSLFAIQAFLDRSFIFLPFSLNRMNLFFIINLQIVMLTLDEMLWQWCNKYNIINTYNIDSTQFVLHVYI